jgi:endonuclease/exonuclease/phosphatase family metal-dependent hydrolase
MRSRARNPSFALAFALSLAGCAPTINLLNPTSPRFEGGYAQLAARPTGSGTTRVKVVSFNIKLADKIGPAIEVLQDDALRDADVISLQEMDETGVERIARALNLNYIYYPGAIHPTRDRYFGPAILSRWPITDSRKLILPHEAWGRKQRRNVTAATVALPGSCLRVYAVHLETQLKASPRQREDQIDVVLRDAATSTCPVVIAGDFNSKGIGRYLEGKGFAWPTEHVGRTITVFSWDHIFARGFPLSDSAAAGKVRQVHGASDHRPIWASLMLAEPHIRTALSR